MGRKNSFINDIFEVSSCGNGHRDKGGFEELVKGGVWVVEREALKPWLLASPEIGVG